MSKLGGMFVVFAAAVVAACAPSSAQSVPPATPVAGHEPQAAAEPDARPDPAAEPADAPVETPPAPVVLQAEVKPASAATKNCPVTVITATRGSQQVAALELQDACDKAPGYECKDSGEGCNTESYQPIGYLKLGELQLVWIKHHAEWHDNGSVDVGLYGYACDQIKRVWGYDWMSPFQETKVEVEPITPGDPVKLTVTSTEMGQTRTSQLAWDAVDCVYRPVKK